MKNKMSFKEALYKVFDFIYDLLFDVMTLIPRLFNFTKNIYLKRSARKYDRINDIYPEKEQVEK